MGLLRSGFGRRSLLFHEWNVLLGQDLPGRVGTEGRAEEMRVNLPSAGGPWDVPGPEVKAVPPGRPLLGAELLSKCVLVAVVLWLLRMVLPKA